ncbi:RagB/SusD family nutrient uptake outer membrane protein [Sphingobacterium faecium]|uniref:RagB/SusD family nutrient uptake outer membrane protein n=1 Tax=Sphingobacterium faecium TaxID=34087 RepID=UPI002469874F|nr:RagB/SusD family nutrient uptake outer membrane protein [Sphingobacterium faecium]MDH5826277.1 RagB/SusD family nutrient uptake outer membrane protein [Sphingobacterium faecium]
MKLYHYIFLLSTLTLGSCSKYLEEFSQDQYQVKTFTDLDELLLGACYYPVKNSSPVNTTESMGAFIHFISDEIEEQNGGLPGQQVFDAKQAIFGQYTWQQRVGVNESNTGFALENATWVETYKLINVSNSIIANAIKLPRSNSDEIQGANRVEGEARFLRASYYFWLVNLYGKPYTKASANRDLGVPLKLQEEVLDILYARNNVQEVYDQILLDLELAEQLLSNTGRQKSIYRADITAVQLLLSRVHLYMQHWEQALSYADKVIAVRPALTNLNSSPEPFLRKESVENIFSMGGNDIFRSMCNSVQSFRVAHDLYNSYHNNDLRKTLWYWSMGDFVGYTKTPPSGTATLPSNINYYSSQYFTSGFRTLLSPVSDKFLYRTAEAYLNKAEAAACLNRGDQAQEMLNLLRSNRYKTGTAFQENLSNNDLILAIRNERRLELALEGHRWFDLRRYGVSDVLPQSKRIVHNYTIYAARSSRTMIERRQYILEENDLGYTLPLPQSVIDFNTGMINNERPVRSFTLIPL